MSAQDTDENRLQRFVLLEGMRSIMAPFAARLGLLDEPVEVFKSAVWELLARVTKDAEIERLVAAKHVDRKDKWTYLVEARMAAGEKVSDEEAALSYRTRVTVLAYMTTLYPEALSAGDVARALRKKLPPVPAREFEPLLRLYVALNYLVHEERGFRAPGPALYLDSQAVAFRRAKLGRKFQWVLPLGEAYLRGEGQALSFHAELPLHLWQKLQRRHEEAFAQILAEVVEESNAPGMDPNAEIEGGGVMFLGPCRWPAPPDVGVANGRAFGPIPFKAETSE